MPASLTRLVLDALGAAVLALAVAAALALGEALAVADAVLAWAFGAARTPELTVGAVTGGAVLTSVAAPLPLALGFAVAALSTIVNAWRKAALLPDPNVKVRS